MPKVRLRWLDGKETTYEHHHLPSSLVLPGDGRLVGDTNPPDRDGLEAACAVVGYRCREG